MIRILKFLEPIRNSLSAIKNILYKEERFEYTVFSKQNNESANKELNILGKDGWKLISVTYDSNKEKSTFWLQRKIGD